MKVPPSRSSHDIHYTPYPPPDPSLPHQTDSFQPPRPPLKKGGRSKSSLSATSGTGTGASAGAVAAAGAGAGAGEETQYKVARAISSCTRCRSRKQKCDGKLPACSACERAKVECIGFDAISKTNISRNYLHSLEQEVQALRAQVASLTQVTDGEAVGNHRRALAQEASGIVSSFSRADLMIDPSLQVDTPIEGPQRSPWDSPSYFGQGHTRGPSEGNYPPTPVVPDIPRSPKGYAPVPSAATSLTRMVHDAAYRTGHAQNHTVKPSPGDSSDIGSIDHPSEGEGVSPNDPQLHRRHSASPLTVSASVSSKGSKRRNFSVPPLPPQQAVERLVAAYVDFVGVAAPILHIPTLGKQIQRIRDGRDVEQADIFVVMMVLALSTMASSRFVDSPNELRACSEAFHAEAMKHLDAVYDEQSYVGLQAILLLIWYALLNPDKGSVWFLVGLASRTCVDLGLHNESNAPLDQVDQLDLDMRRRLFWCTYKMDRLLCFALGRPPSIPDGYISVPPSSNVHDVDIVAGNFGPIRGQLCSYKAVFAHSNRLRIIQSEILDRTYGIHRVNGAIDPPPPEWFEDSYERLKAWLEDAPETRGTVSAEGHAIAFHNTASLLFRPSPGNPRPGKDALSRLLESSSFVIKIYRRMQLNKRISWLWFTSHFTFMAGLSFLYAFFNLYSIGGGSGVINLEDAKGDIDSALAVLESLSTVVPSAAACHGTLHLVSKAIFDQLTASAPPSAASPGGRGILRGAPISSSRDDPLPNPNESFPAPLPAVALPYEMSLLDNLFVNPMSSHAKASDYTNCKPRCGTKPVKKPPTDSGLVGKFQGNGSVAYNTSGLSQGALAFGGSPLNGQGVHGGNRGAPGSALSPSVAFGSAEGNTGLQMYGLAAQMGNVGSPVTPSTFGYGALSGGSQTVSGGASGQGNGYYNGLGGGGGGGGGSGVGGRMTELVSAAVGESAALGANGNNGAGQGVGTDGGFDLLTYLMGDEEGGGAWESFEVPSDFSLWS